MRHRSLNSNPSSSTMFRKSCGIRDLMYICKFLVVFRAPGRTNEFRANKWRLISLEGSLHGLSDHPPIDERALANESLICVRSFLNLTQGRVFPADELHQNSVLLMLDAIEDSQSSILLILDPVEDGQSSKLFVSGANCSTCRQFWTLALCLLTPATLIPKIYTLNPNPNSQNPKPKAPSPKLAALKLEPTHLQVQNSGLLTLYLKTLLAT